MSDPCIQNWSAWAPGLPDRTDWQKPVDRDELLDGLKGDEAPDVDWVPARTRRRCSNLTRIALHVGFDCCENAGVDPSDVKTVFSTRHGEITPTFGLLKSLADDELISPMSFGNSVHNTPSSYFCILADNHHPSRTVSACRETFQNGFMDAMGLRNTRPDHPVLLVHAHTPLPHPLDRFESITPLSYGAAFLLSDVGDADRISCSLEESVDGQTFRLPAAIAFLNWYLSGEQQTLYLPRSNSSTSWIWRRKRLNQ